MQSGMSVPQVAAMTPAFAQPRGPATFESLPREYLFRLMAVTNAVPWYRKALARVLPAAYARSTLSKAAEKVRYH